MPGQRYRIYLPIFAYASNNGSFAEGSFIRYSMKFLQSRLLGYLCLAYRGWPIYVLLGVNQVFRMYGSSWDPNAKWCIWMIN